MRFLVGLVLVLLFVPTGAFSAPCCEETPADTCCPVDRSCDESTSCPAAIHLTAVRTAPPSAVLPSPLALPLAETVGFVRHEAPVSSTFVPPPRLVVLRN